MSRFGKAAIVRGGNVLGRSDLARGHIAVAGTSSLHKVAMSGVLQIEHKAQITLVPSFTLDKFRQEKRRRERYPWGSPKSQAHGFVKCMANKSRVIAISERGERRMEIEKSMISIRCGTFDKSQENQIRHPALRAQLSGRSSLEKVRWTFALQTLLTPTQSSRGALK